MSYALMYNMSFLTPRTTSSVNEHILSLQYNDLTDKYKKV